MKAMILAAGFGTRLKPYTDHKPKALIEINGVPMLELLINKLKKYRITDIIINIHHFTELIIEFLAQRSFGINIEQCTGIFFLFFFCRKNDFQGLLRLQQCPNVCVLVLGICHVMYLLYV